MAQYMPFGSRDRDENGKLLLQVVSSVLDELVCTNNMTNADNPEHKREVTKFHGLRAPSIGVPQYLERISKFSGCSNECFVLSLIYIDRLITRKLIVLDSLNVHRLVITSVMLAAKYFDDHYLDNAHYGAVGGVPRPELNVLELEFLFLLEFNLHVTPSDYEMYRSALSNKSKALGNKSAAASPVGGAVASASLVQAPVQSIPMQQQQQQPIYHPQQPLRPPIQMQQQQQQQQQQQIYQQQQMQQHHAFHPPPQMQQQQQQHQHQQQQFQPPATFYN